MKDSIFKSYKLMLYKQSDNKSFEDFLKEVPKDFCGNIFKELERDSIGRSGANPTWVRVYHYENGEVTNPRIALYKDYDYDEPSASYSEKLWSILGKTILEGVRVPDIDIVYKNTENYPETISYRILDNNTEDLILMSTVLDSEFWKTKIQMRDCCMIEELLEAVRKYIDKSKNNQNKYNNYKKLEKEIIYTILLDAISNNADRHPLNWGLVEDSISGSFELALFDHSGTFKNIMTQVAGVQNRKWMPTYLKIDPNYRTHKMLIGDSSEKIVNYINLKYPEYFSEFSKILEEKAPQFISQIDEEPFLKSQLLQIKKDLQMKINFFKKTLNRGEIYED